MLKYWFSLSGSKRDQTSDSDVVLWEQRGEWAGAHTGCSWSRTVEGTQTAHPLWFLVTVLGMATLRLEDKDRLVISPAQQLADNAQLPGFGKIGTGETLLQLPVGITQSHCPDLTAEHRAAPGPALVFPSCLLFPCCLSPSTCFLSGALEGKSRQWLHNATSPGTSYILLQMAGWTIPSFPHPLHLQILRNASLTQFKIEYRYVCLL